MRHLSMLTLAIPSYRVDVTREADVTEEVLRIYGYDNIGISSEMHSMLSHPDKPDREKVEANMAELLTGNGFSEIMCNSLVPAAWFETTGDFDAASMVRLANPLSSDLNVMRMSLLPGMLSTISRNINRQNSDLRLFELGYTYSRKPGRGTMEITDNYSERPFLALAVTGNINGKRWNAAETPSGFFHIKGYTELVLSRFGITGKGDHVSPGERRMVRRGDEIQCRRIRCGIIRPGLEKVPCHVRHKAGGVVR
ncbi:MAG: hypothetical protein MZV63_62635 [Marinilabiliales bacterium]|nr:hypothetical protein [Marinilabiliales bacterium]